MYRVITPERLFKALIIIMWLGMCIGAFSAICTLAGCSGFTNREIERITLDPDGNEVREIQREEFDEEAFVAFLSRILVNVPEYYRVYLEMERSRLELRREVLELNRLEKEISEAEYDARIEAIDKGLEHVTNLIGGQNGGRNSGNGE